MVLSVVDTVERKSYPLLVGQRIKEKSVENEPGKGKKKKRSKQKGRPCGSRNRDKGEFKPSSEMKQLNEMLKMLLKSLRQFVKVRYLTLDGHFGNNQAVLLARQNELELISKLRRDAVLFEKYEGEQARRGARRKYGKRLRYVANTPNNLSIFCAALRCVSSISNPRLFKF
jgi:putative transposase